ncbi:MAG: hypothetical protein ACI4JY_07210 [Oscillospiraceae bacterium]
MKFLKKLTDWKTWLFTILPIALIVAHFSIIFSILASNKYTTALVIIAMALLTVALLLMSGSQIFLRIREKHYLRPIIAVVFLLLSLGLQITAIVRVPDLIEKEQEKQRLHQILEDTPYDDPEYRERFDAWGNAVDRANDASTTLKWIVWGSYASWVFVALSAHTGKHETDEDKDKKEENQE